VAWLITPSWPAASDSLARSRDVKFFVAVISVGTTDPGTKQLGPVFN
jgi:hypothetical protein